MPNYTMLAEVEIEPDAETVAYPILQITYSYSPGSPAVMYQSNGDPGWPAEPADVEFISATLVSGDGLTPTKAQIDSWAGHYLDSDDGYRAAVDHAEDMRRPDPDDAYDRQRDEPTERDEWRDYDPAC